MNLQAAWLAPWRSSVAATRWVALVLLLLSAFGAVALGRYADKPTWWVGSVVFVGGVEAMLWLLVMSKTMLLAMDGRQLRLPGVQSSVIAALLLYGLLSVLLPTVVFSLFAGHAGAIATLVALFCVGGFLFALLPRYLVMMMYLVPVALKLLPTPFDLPGPASPDFVGWALPAVIALLLAAILCCRFLLRADNPYKSGWSQPLLMKFRASAPGGGRHAWAGGVDSSAMIRRRPDWMQPRADLGGCGPRHAVANLRVALGGLFLPLTVVGWLRQIVLVFVPSLLFVLLMTWQGINHDSARSLEQFSTDGGLVMLIWFGALGTMLLGFFFVMQLGRQWQKTNAELPLLALLPGVGSGVDIKRDLLRAVLLPPLRLQFSLLIVLVILTAGLHKGTQVETFVSLSQLGGMAFGIAFALVIIGGRVPRKWVTAALTVFSCIMINVSLFVPTMNDPGKIQLGFMSLQTLLIAGWIAFAVVLFWLGRRGWRGLQQRPHPFLAT
jgi:hypothetical protein